MEVAGEGVVIRRVAEIIPFPHTCAPGPSFRLNSQHPTEQAMNLDDKTNLNPLLICHRPFKARSSSKAGKKSSGPSSRNLSQLSSHSLEEKDLQMYSGSTLLGKTVDEGALPEAREHRLSASSQVPVRTTGDGVDAGLTARSWLQSS